MRKLAIGSLAAFLCAGIGFAQTAASGGLVAAGGEVHPLLARATASVPADLATPMQHMVLPLKVTAAQEASLENLIAEQADPQSPNYHKYLDPASYGAQFGASAADIQTVTSWLKSQGFTVDPIPAGNRLVVFSGTVEQVNSAFQTEMRLYTVEGETHLANATAPQIPASLANIVSGVVRLHDFPYKSHAVVPARSAQGINGQFNMAGSMHELGPADYYTIYNINPLLNAGIDGTGQSIAVLARSNLYVSDVESFRDQFGLKPNAPELLVTNSDPGIVAGDVIETTMDTEWAGAVAPGANIKVVISSSTGAADGVELSAIYAVNNKIAPIISVSYGNCEASMGATELAAFHSLWKQAAAQGQTVLVASGDTGAAGCDTQAETTAASGEAVNGLCSSPYATCVGGTEFVEGGNPGQYWLTGNSSTLGSVISYIPETVWNESGTVMGGSGLEAGGGGVSSTYQKPAWQTGPGVPADGMRDVPDVSLTAAMHDGYTIVQGGQMAYVFSIGGTSAATPSFAGLVALINQKYNSTQGNINPVLYPLAARQAAGGAAIFHDITTGNNSVPGLSGYNAGAGYDLASGLGSVDANMLVNHWNDAAVSTNPLTVTTYAASVNVGGTSSASVTTLTSGLKAAVTLTISGLPAGVTAAFAPATMASPGSGTASIHFTAAASAVAGNYKVTVTGTAGTQSATSSFNLTVLAGTFQLNGPTDPMGMANGASMTWPVTITPQNGMTSTITLGTSGLPTGVTATFAPATVSGSAPTTSTMTITTAKTAKGGSYPFSITASGGTVSKALPETLAINVNSTCNLVASPATLTVASGGTGSVALSCPGGANPIALTAYPPIPGVMTSTLSSRTLQPGGTVILTVSAPASVPQGNYTFLVTGTDNVTGALQEPNIPMSVTGPNANLNLSPSSLTMAAGSSGSVTVSWAGTSGSANIWTSGLGNGMSRTVSAITPGASSAVLTIAADPSTAAGTYSVTVGLIAGVTQRSATLKVIVTPSAGPTCNLATAAPDIIVNGNQSSPTTLTCAVTHGQFTGPLAISIAGLPNGVTAQVTNGTLTPGSSTALTASASNIATPGPAMLSITASGSGYKQTINLPIMVNMSPTFSLNASATAATVNGGGTAQVTLTSTLTNGFNAAVALSVAGLPSGVTATLSKTSLAAPGSGSSVVTFAAASSAVGGTYAVSVTGSGGGMEQTVPVSLTVVPAPSFALAAASSTVTVKIGATVGVNLTTTVANGFKSAVTLSASSVPSGVTASFTSGTLAAPGSGTATVTFAASSSATTGTYSVSLVATGGGLTRSVPVTVTVQAPPSFSVAKSSTSTTVKRGATAQVTLTTAALNGFNSAVSLSASGLPAGVTATFSKTSVAAPGSGSSVVTFNAAATAKTGSYTINLVGTGSGVTQTITQTVVVQ
jgi:uncharacterized membrane protein